MNKDRLINLERLNQFKLNLVESKDNSLDITNEDQSKIDIKAKISEEEGNILTLKEDGLYVAPDGSLLSTDNSISIEVTDEGTDLTLKKSEEEDNAIEKKEDGVFVQKYDMATEDEVMALLGSVLKLVNLLYLQDGTIIENESEGDFILFDFKSDVEKVELCKKVTGLGVYAFSSCRNLKSVTIPDSVTKIEANAFYNCESLEGIILPNGVLSIGAMAFAICKKLTNLIIPNSVVTIDNNAFGGCSNLESVVLSANLGSISDHLFDLCSKLNNIVIPNKISTIGEYAFNFCESLNNITIPNSIIAIGEKAFSNCPESGTLRCNQEWFNNLSEENRTNLGNLANWTKEWID